MRKKWLRNEGEKWVKKGIIDEKQYQGIMASYGSDGKNPNSILYSIAGILFSLGILAAIATNWNNLPHLLRLLILILGTSGFYIAGEVLTRKNRTHLGAVAIGLGVVTFGSGLILSGQMFQWTAYDARVFILWSIVSIISLFLYRNHSLYLLTLALLTAGQVYSIFTFPSFSWGLLLLTFGLGFYAERVKRVSLVWSTVGTFIIQILLIIGWGTSLSLTWVIPILLAIYLLGDVLSSTQWKNPLQSLATFTTFLLAMGIQQYEFHGEYVYTVAGLLVASVICKVIQKRSCEGFDLLLFLPFCFVGPVFKLTNYIGVLTWSIYKIFLGKKRGSKATANVGMILFLITVLNTYFNGVWDFMPKPLFFLLSGLLLFIANLFLQSEKLRFAKYFSKGGN